MARRETPHYWLCRCTARNPFSMTVCPDCGIRHNERYAQPRAEDRAVVYLNPATGEHRTPPRADQPIPDIYVRQGFERHEIMSMTAFERQSGMVHEDTNFHAGNEPSPDQPTARPEIPRDVRDALIRDVMEAHQSGAWTDDTPDGTQFITTPAF